VSIELQFPLDGLGGGVVPLETEFEEPLALGPVVWLPSHRAHVVLWPSSFLGLGVTLFPLAGVGLFGFLGVASSSGYSFRRALLPDRMDPSGRPPSESSQSSRS
jgi:hypothetical protein